MTKKIIGECKKAVEKILQEYATKQNKIYGEFYSKLKKLDNIDDYDLYVEKENELYDEKIEKTQELEEEVIDMLDEQLSQILSRYENKATKHEIVWRWVDSVNTFSAMQIEHYREYLHVCNVIIYPHIYVFDAVFYYVTAYQHESIELDDIIVTQRTLIDEKTPFCLKLIEKIPWHLIRDTWRHQITDLIEQLTIAERAGRLDEKLAEVKQYCEKNAWIYDFAHLLNAINETLCEKPQTVK